LISQANNFVAFMYSTDYFHIHMDAVIV